jgi:hypothetical protein
MAAMLVPNSKEVNEIILLKGDQYGRRPHHCKSRIGEILYVNYMIFFLQVDF